jgi:hypothetical protein
MPEIPRILEYDSVDRAPPLPAAVVVIGWVYIGLGLLTAFETGRGIVQDRLNVDVGAVLAVFIGRGLLRRSETSRLWAVFIAWTVMIGAGLLAVFGVVAPRSGELELFGERIDGPPILLRGVALAAATAFFLVSYWQYRVINRAEVKALFEDRAMRGDAPTGRQAAWLWALWVWFALLMIAVGAGCLWGWALPAASRITPPAGPSFVGGPEQNAAMVDDTRNIVAIGFGLPVGCNSAESTLTVGGSPKRYAIPRQKDSLFIVLPDGQTGTFRVPEGFARAFERGSGSWLKLVPTLMGNSPDRARLEQFLASYQQPASTTQVFTSQAPASTPTTQLK